MAGPSNLRPPGYQPDESKPTVFHDLRHTSASTAVGLDLGLPPVAASLGQAHLATTQRYAHLDIDPRRRAEEAVAAQLHQLLGRREEPKAILEANPIPRAKRFSNSDALRR